MIILSLFVLQVLPAALCFDIALIGKLKVAEKYLAALRQPSELVNLILSYLPEQIVGKGKLPRALEVLVPLRTVNNTQNTTTEIKEEIKILPKQIPKHVLKLEYFKEYCKNLGTTAIHIFSKAIVADLGIKKNVSSIIAMTNDEYRNMLQNYFDYYVKKNHYNADRDLLYLDMVETSTRLLLEGEKKLLNDIFMHENQNDHRHFKIISKELLKGSYLFKRETMEIACKNYDVCKEYPAVSDYGSEIISEMLLLDDLQFLTIIKILSKNLTQNDSIIARIIEIEDRQLIMAKLQNFTNDTFAAKEFLALVRAVITQRFKPITSGSEEFKTKMKATRLLLDILDKAFNIEDDVITIDIENSLEAIRNWAVHKRHDIGKILEEFANNLMIRLEHNLTQNAKKEIKSLITALMRKNTETFDRLMRFGSDYLKGKDFHPDIDIMAH